MYPGNHTFLVFFPKNVLKIPKIMEDNPCSALAPAPSPHINLVLPLQCFSTHSLCFPTHTNPSPTTPFHVIYGQYIHNTMWKYVPMFSGMLTFFGINAQMDEFVNGPNIFVNGPKRSNILRFNKNS